MKKLLLILLCLGSCATMVAQTTRNLRGMVLNTDGQPLNGTTIQIKGTAEKTITDASGRFTLATSTPQPVLLVAHMGYATQEYTPSVDSTTFTIVLQRDAVLMEDVTVSTGYQRLPRERATGSFSSLDAQVLSRSTSTDILSRLEGIAPSVLFDRRGTSDKISIRGRSTLFANDQPLVVVDNFPYDGDLRNIHPDDVESITLLKDAAAASIWGTRAANGVVVITTKKGRREQSPQVNYHFNMTVVDKPDFGLLPSMSSADFIEMEQFLFGKNFYRSQETSASRPLLSPVVELLIRQRDGLASPEATAGALEELRRQDVRNDFDRYLYDYALQQQHQLSVQGGGTRHTYRLSAGYDNNKNHLAASYRRYTLRVDQSFRLSDRLDVTAGLAYTQSQSADGRTPYTSINPGGGKELYPYARLADEAGNPLALPKTYREAFILGAPAAGLLDWQYRPLDDHRYNSNKTTGQEVVLQGGLTYRLIKGLSLEARYQYQHSTGEGRNLQGEGAWQTRDFINRYTQVVGGSLQRPIPLGGILDMSTSRQQGHTARGQLNYNRYTANGQLTAIVGTEIRELTDRGSYYRTYGYQAGKLAFAQVNYDSSYQQYHNRNLRSTIPNSAGFTDRIDRYLSFYANAAYTYRNRYTVSASGRRDGSNLFGARTNQKMVPLWSAGLAWNLAAESFYQSGILPKLRLRATYGYNGNRDNTTSAFTSIRYNSAQLNEIIKIPYATIIRLPNPELRWEKVGILNVGIDFGFADDRIRGSIEAYQKKARDLLGEAPIDPTLGWPSGKLRVNTGRLLTQGVDLELNTRNITGDFAWETALLVSYSANRLTYYDSSQIRARTFVTGGNTIHPLVGKPVQYIMSYPWAGLDSTTGDPQGFIDGHPSKNYQAILNNTPVAGLIYHGPAVAPWFGSLRNTFSWKGWELSALITFRMGYYFRRPSLIYNQLFNSWRGHADYAQRWQKPGDEAFTNVPSMVYPANTNRDNFYTLTSPLVERGDHIRLQDLRLAYQFPTERWRKNPLRDLQCYLYARNLGRIWKKTSVLMDPDYGNSLPDGPAISFGIRTTLQ